MHALVILEDVAKLPCIEIIPITLPLWRVSLPTHFPMYCLLLFFFFTAFCGMGVIISQTRDRTSGPCSGSAKS